MHIVWLRQLLRDMLPERYQTAKETVPLGIDNKSAIACSKKQAPTKKSKYIDVRYHHLQDLVAQKVIAPIYIPSIELQADLLTKPLGPEKYIRLRNKLGIAPPPTIPTAVGVS